MKDLDSAKLEILYESVLLNEVNLERDFPDVPKKNVKCMSADEVEEALNKEIERLNTISKDRPSAPKTFPRFSRGNIDADEKNKANINDFIRKLTKLPTTIFDKGIKSKHSTTSKVETVNTGIPALRALLWDGKKQHFYVVNTCPGAGTCPINCYAMNSFYIMQDGKNLKLANRLQLLMDNPDMYQNMAYRELEVFAFSANRDDKILQIRWNDAGDFFSETYFMMAVNITNKLKEKNFNVASYAYTKLAKFYKMGEQNGLVMNFSDGASLNEIKQIGDLNNIKMSFIIPVNIWKHLFVKTSKHVSVDENGQALFKGNKDENKKILKQIIFDYFKNINDPKYAFVKNHLDINRIIYTNELPENEGQKYQYDCIVLPQGDSDAPAQRRDVKYTFLLEH
jgi:hypothetical protein